VTARDTTHAVTQLLQGGVDDFIESERLRLFCFRMIGRARHGVFCAQHARQLRYRIADRSSDRRCQNSFACPKTSQSKSHLGGETPAAVIRTSTFPFVSAGFGSSMSFSP